MLALLLAAFLTACSSGSAGGSSAPGAEGPGRGAPAETAQYAPLGADGEIPPWERQARAAAQDPSAAAPRARPAEVPAVTPAPVARPAQPTGPRIRVVWEALTVERDRCANPRFRRQPTRGTMTMQKVVLVSHSHPDARRVRAGATTRTDQGVAVGALPDQELDLFVKGLERRGFFRLARPTSSVQHLFDGESARGRVTVEVGGESRTLLSMRGQGLNPATKQIPPLYSEVKRTVIALRNQTSTLTVVGVGRDPMNR